MTFGRTRRISRPIENLVYIWSLHTDVHHNAGALRGDYGYSINLKHLKSFRREPIVLQWKLQSQKNHQNASSGWAERERTLITGPFENDRCTTNVLVRDRLVRKAHSPQNNSLLRLAYPRVQNNPTSFQGSLISPCALGTATRFKTIQPCSEVISLNKDRHMLYCPKQNDNFS